MSKYTLFTHQSSLLEPDFQCHLGHEIYYSDVEKPKKPEMNKVIICDTGGPGEYAWIKPLLHCYALNVDASLMKGKTSVAYILRDCLGFPIRGAYFKIPQTCNSSSGEIYALWHGFKMLDKYPSIDVTVESDNSDACKVAVELPLYKVMRHPERDAILEIRDILFRNPQIDLRHVYRQRNMVVNGLAQLCAKDVLADCFRFSKPPSEIEDLLRNDRLGVTYTRPATRTMKKRKKISRESSPETGLWMSDRYGYFT